MFEVGQYIIHGTFGVCRIENIGATDHKAIEDNKIYYTLEPVYFKGSKIFTPIDNPKALIRPVISKEEALELIEEMKSIEPLSIPDEKKREEIYKSSLRTCNNREWISMIKNLYEKNQSRKAEGKKITAYDEKYLRMAQENLHGELAIALDIAKDKVEEFIIARIGA